MSPVEAVPRRHHRWAKDTHGCNCSGGGVFNSRPMLVALVLLILMNSLPVSSFFCTFSSVESSSISRIRQSFLLESSSSSSPRPLQATAKDDGYDGLGEYDPSEGINPQRKVVVGDPQIRLKEKERSVTSILKELAAIQQQGPQKYCILGTRHCSYLHQQIIELLYVVPPIRLIDLILYLLLFLSW